MKLLILVALVIGTAAKTGVVELAAYPGQSNTGVGGTVVVTTKDATTVTLSYHLSGLTGVSGGLHIHSNTSCDVGAGPHHWDVQKYPVDPWKKTFWNGDKGSFEVVFGYSVDEVIGRTVVVHDSTGTKLPVV